ncbi:GntR family transcriptional regulator [Paenibacillus cisolokensis]|jgi:DNA-binding GntR family transcriptional regulator|uniref:GntR family transcriptional regulator n=1 Tax=Paenibacillus cisolokensis TaxID=1658519 RepID=A0ABQ4NBD4_9BACL|nr:GntR family transcriptional regulator [Paenibacillus cisolokensis]GIQ65529.1 GntR family transcriptional regulator [Paenibacillus cisolokensis]
MAETLKEKAYTSIRQRILDGTLKAGEFLTERSLVETLGMSRTPIRAALERLDVEGLVWYTPNKGLVVAEISLNRVDDFFDFRTALECHIVRKLAQRNWDQDDVDWFEENLRQQQQYVQDNDCARFTEADSLFHRKLARVYDNAEIVQTIESLQDRFYRTALSVLQKDAGHIQVSCEDHAAIFALIRQGEGDAAARKMEQHLVYGKRILVM